MPLQIALTHYGILTAMLAPALLMAATGSLLSSANHRLARVVDRLRVLLATWHKTDPQMSADLDEQIARHRLRCTFVLRACVMLYLALASFIGTSLALAADAISGYRLPLLPTILAIMGVLCLLAACVYLGREVNLSVRSFDLELDMEMRQRRG